MRLHQRTADQNSPVLKNGDCICPALGLRLITRQIQIAKRLAVGDSVKKIAGDIGLSPKTVEYHWTVIRKALRVDSYQQLVHFCLAHDLVPNLYGEPTKGLLEKTRVKKLRELLAQAMEVLK